MADGTLSPRFGAQPESPAQGAAYLPFGSPGTPRRLSQRNDLSRLVALPGAREHLAAPVIGKLGGLMWVHVIHLLSPGGATARLTASPGPAGPGEAAPSCCRLAVAAELPPAGQLPPDCQ